MKYPILFWFMLFLIHPVQTGAQEQQVSEKNNSLYIIRPLKTKGALNPIILEINGHSVGRLPNNAYTIINIEQDEIIEKETIEIYTQYGAAVNNYIVPVDSSKNYFLEIVPKRDSAFPEVDFKMIEESEALLEISQNQSRYVSPKVNKSGLPKTRHSRNYEFPENIISTGILNPISLGTIVIGFGAYNLLEYERFTRSQNASFVLNYNLFYSYESAEETIYTNGFGISYRNYKPYFYSGGIGVNIGKVNTLNSTTGLSEKLGYFVEPKIEFLSTLRKKGFTIKQAIELGYVFDKIEFSDEDFYIGTLGTNNFMILVTFYFGWGW